MTGGVVFVDVFDGKDGIVGVEGSGLLDTGTSRDLETGSGDRLSGYVWSNFFWTWKTHQAYAPWPIVSETMRKGTLMGSGANWECCISGRVRFCKE